MSIYSMIGNEKLLIQGRQLPFDNIDVIPLGVNIITSGRYSIGIGALDGLFADSYQNIYLEDKVTQKIQNLKTRPYSFTSNAGTFNNRFKLRFRNHDDDDDKRTATNNILLTKSDTEISIISSNETIESIVIYDLVGREVYSANAIGNKFFNVDLVVLNQQVLIVKITLENGKTVTKKLIY